MKSISAILAARNEESHIEQTVRSLAAQAEVAEIIVVNDQSTDRTGEILAGLAAQLPQLKTLAVIEVPEGWVGKNHAVWLGAQAARGEWLLFTDADVTHLPGSAARALWRTNRRYAAQLRANSRRWSDVLYYLPAVFLYSAALVASARAHSRGRVVWKGREYPI